MRHAVRSSVNALRNDGDFCCHRLPMEGHWAGGEGGQIHGSFRIPKGSALLNCKIQVAGIICYLFGINYFLTATPF